MQSISGLSIASLESRAQTGSFSDAELAELAEDQRAGARKLASRIYRQRAAAQRERERLLALTCHERELHAQGRQLIAGVDEVGAGPLAGPVVAAAVIFAPGTLIEGVDDSKKLSETRRRELAQTIRATAVSVSIGACTPAEIDRLNIYQASREAMRRAVDGLDTRADHLLVDARTVPKVLMPQTPLKKGDQRSLSIAAASILAKVYRDGLMEEYGRQYPGYGFEAHAGYPTSAHLKALSQLGVTPIHRRSFGPVQRCVAESGE